ncbi:hypothetical protein DNTS_029627 [Danionella cerebrum]|uniref:Centrosomal protein of 19 kDa n=1 Tax=Danionella cerebrum TaxID=2873325 RepID=A0A553QPJ8_9TELE|nr:hypothetical protein DNTS_029627 [Danionella translucida]
MSLEAKRCGVKFSPPSIIIIYENTGSGEKRKRTIPVRNFSLLSDCRRAAEHLKLHPHHQVYLQRVSEAQLEKLYLLLQDHLKGLSLKENNQEQQEDELEHHDPLEPKLEEVNHTSGSNQDSDVVSSVEDLNQLSDGELQRRKDQMDELFQRNRRRQGDPGFVYDLQVDFPEGSTKESCSWDEEEDEE